VTDATPSLSDAAERATMPGRTPGPLPPLSLEAPPAAPPAVALAIGLAIGRARVLQRPTALTALLGAALVVVSGIIERRVGSAGAVDRALAATFNVVVPLTSFAVAAEVSGRGDLRAAAWAAARFGVARRDVALGAIGAAALASATLGAGFAALAVLVAHAEGNAPLLHDLFTSAWIAALTAAAYTAWFTAGATFGRRGGGRWVPLVADFVLGGSTGLAGAILPRAHATSLLGGAAPLGLSQASSSAVLAVSVVVLASLAAFRCRESASR
jgi:hypothetical protein